MTPLRFVARRVAPAARLAVRPAAATTTLITAPITAPAARRLSAAAVLRHSESQSHNPDYPIEKHKEESLQQQKKGSGEWMAALASDSEQVVKADKSAFDAKDPAHRSSSSTEHNIKKAATATYTKESSKDKA